MLTGHNFLKVSHPGESFLCDLFERTRNKSRGETSECCSAETGFLFCSRSFLKGGRERNEIPLLLHHRSLALRRIALFILAHHLPATSHSSSSQPRARVCPRSQRINFSCFFLLRGTGFTGDVEPLHLLRSQFEEFPDQERVTSEEKWLLAGRSLTPIRGRDLRRAATRRVPGRSGAGMGGCEGREEVN